MLACADEDGLDRYALHGMWRVRGLRDLSIVDDVFERLAGRHEILRTRLLDRDGDVLQEISPTVATRVAVVSLDAAKRRPRVEALRHLLRSVVREPIDLRSAPWQRATLVRLGRRQHLLLVSVSHAAADAYGWSVLAREIERSLTATDGRVGAGSEPLQFQEFARRERQLARPVAGTPAWVARLNRRPPRVPFSTGQELDAPVRERAVPLTPLPAAAVGRLEGIARSAFATLPMAVLALFLVVLVRSGASDDVIVGAFDANRRMEGSDAAMGCFVTLTLLDVVLEPDRSFNAVVEQVRDRFLERLDEPVPLEVQAARLPPRGAQPLTRRLCDVLFNYQGYIRPPAVSAESDSEVTVASWPLVQAPLATARAPWAGASLGLTVRAGARGGLEAWLTFDENALCRERLDLVMVRWRAVARRIVAHPERPINRV